MEKVLQWLNWVLVADFFFVLLSLFWLTAAVIGRTTGIPLGLDLWYDLWEPLFTPAIGLLMGGALLTAAIGQINKYLDRRNEEVGR
ncbi:MAG: hypothetical protein J7641_20560 [Cyanobacteria bacterium SID2]|nr:hypothetical protein [Cyanobacteria bacterium SID2]MBP0003496.1 hypothetical protein [Cyanobacteria bacterium SBC]